MALEWANVSQSIFYLLALFRLHFQAPPADASTAEASSAISSALNYSSNKPDKGKPNLEPSQSKAGGVTNRQPLASEM